MTDQPRPAAYELAALIEEICVGYEQGATLRDLAAKHGRSFAWIRRLLIEAGVELRQKGRAGRVLQPCGTRSAYVRHLRRGEKACELCLLANSANNKSQRNAYSAARSRAFRRLRTEHEDEYKAFYRASKDDLAGDGRTPKSRAAVAMQRAFSALAARYPERFKVLLAEERASVPATPADQP